MVKIDCPTCGERTYYDILPVNLSNGDTLVCECCGAYNEYRRPVRQTAPAPAQRHPHIQDGA